MRYINNRVYAITGGSYALTARWKEGTGFVSNITGRTVELSVNQQAIELDDYERQHGTIPKVGNGPMAHQCY